MLNDVPQAGQTLGITQPLIRNNFSTIDTVFSVDHVSYNSTGAGKHNKVTFPVQGAAPVFLAGEYGLYNLNYADSGSNELFVTDSAGVSFPMTAALFNQDGWTYLPSGIIMQWGFGNANPNTQTQINFSKQFPTVAYIVQITQFTFMSVVTPNTLTVGQPITNHHFNVNNSGAAASLYWFAVGR